MATTLHDVARLSGFSIKTVSQVINGVSTARPSTQQAVLKAVEELGYRPNVSARSLKSGRTGVIGFAVPSTSAPYFAELTSLVVSAARSRGLNVIIEESESSPEREFALSHGELNWADGWLAAPQGTGWTRHVGADFQLPLVVLDDEGPSPVHTIAYNNLGMAQEATRHLIARGRTRIAVIGAASQARDLPSSLRQRIQGYRDALEEAGLGINDSLFAGTATAWTREAGAALWRSLRASQVRFDAVLAMNDAMAIGAMRAAVDEGVRIPHDVAFIGIDDIDDCRFCVPTLTSVQPGKQEMVERAIETLAALIAKTDLPEFGSPYPQFRVVPRQSTAT